MRLILLLLISLSSIAQARIYVSADGKALHIDARGRNGADGANGSNGNTSCDSSGQRVDGAPGEDGKDGEKGEDGDDVYIFYTNEHNLKKIYVDASPGSGGSGGRGGLGDFGCNGGFHGGSGQSGSSGSDGEIGKVYLLPNLAEYPAESFYFTGTLDELLKVKPVLSWNVWSSISNIKNLLAPNSNVASRAEVLQEVRKLTVHTNWQGGYYDNNIGKNRVRVSLDSRNNSAALSFSDGIFAEYDVVKEGASEVSINIKKLITDIFNFKVTLQKGGWLKPDYVLIKEQGAMSNATNTRFEVVVLVKERFSTKSYTAPVNMKDLKVSRDGTMSFDITQIIDTQLSKQRSFLKKNSVQLRVLRSALGHEQYRDFDLGLKI